MAALTGPRNTATRDGKKYAAPAAAAKKFFAGGLVMIDAAGNATPGATALNLKKGGRMCDTVDNLSGAAGAKTVEFEKGLFRFNNSSAGDAITRAEIDTDAYVVDDQTVAKTNGGGTRSIAGKIKDLDAQGVWILID